MANLKALKLKRESINKTRKVTRAMEAVSAVKMRKSQERALGGRPYAAGALRVLDHLSTSVDVNEHPLFAARSTGKVGVLLITSDKGLAGSLNSAALKQVSKILSDDSEKYVFICIGRRGHDFVKNRGYEVIHYEENKSDEVSEAQMRKITESVLALHRSADTARWLMIYTNFQSTFEQVALARQLLPLSKEALEEAVLSITPDKGKFSDTEKQKAATFAYTVEPNADEILDAIVDTLVNIMLYHALLETKASEHSARMVAMKNATDKAGELSHDLLLRFNKARQAVITREVSEITSGIEAMS